ncbi:transcriptional Regulator of molybdate metabolism, XRE family protein [Tolypothrix tenuis PCC 7101]|uniref:Transcriptional Regulator of molybdate metabolism, XRE family protein n=1 Tax=Tolypothrix tenuis PCC 7101 TaxID=231146 RepID=A0A1Z4N2L0_9CYAN|nr:helix-turn-helix domain-containing protein [Aulosira sp. FACHB-113]BAY99945.1 transcriptional Regulator of molybdate metabolism, XRE family protein [Tolypothrix tenuis PCC 7101]BAZ76133.1 transcriptional Regulator of molybdate metabolism, XRE family protein [Aulosira laxa NIES-50]
MKLDANVCNNLKSIRTRLGMSQQDLANIAGVTRQAISSVESGQYAPSVAISLRLAKALGCQVEELFWLEDDLPEVEAVLTKPVPSEQQLRVSLAKIGGQWIAYPLIGKDAFRMEMIPADGKAHIPTTTNKVQVQLLDDIDKLHNTVVIAGCTPVISFLAKATERWYPQLRVHYHFANSMAALRSLDRGEVHIAGMHLYDPETEEHNIPFVREALADRSAVLITLGIWEEGLMVQPGNPMEIKNLADLVELGGTIINREPGSGSRMLLERQLNKEKISLDTLKGSERIVHSHQDVALAIASGIADAGVSTSSIAAAFGLGFVPLHQARYDLVILKEYLEESPVQQFLGILGHRLVQSQLKVLGGYDISKIGEVVATI